MHNISYNYWNYNFIFPPPVSIIIRLERTAYTVDEGDGRVEVCAAIMQPTDLSFIGPTYQANFNISAISQTALGT